LSVNTLHFVFLGFDINDLTSDCAHQFFQTTNQPTF